MLVRKIADFKWVLVFPEARTLPGWKWGAVELPPYISVNRHGCVTVDAGYPWDGPSGPTVDRRKNIGPSLWHDVGYELLRAGLLPWEARLYFDELFRRDLIKAGMSKWLARVYYWGVRIGGRSSAKRQKSAKYKVYMV